MPDDARLIQIVDAALTEAARRSGHWLACRPGCFECCIGTFAISSLDAERLRRGLAELESRDPERAQNVRHRAAAYRGGEEEACPALDPQTGTCDLYAARPLTCRSFGPAVRGPGGIGICELCYRGATAEEIASCAIDLDIDALEAPLLQDARVETTVAAALA